MNSAPTGWAFYYRRWSVQVIALVVLMCVLAGGCASSAGPKPPPPPPPAPPTLSRDFTIKATARPSVSGIVPIAIVSPRRMGEGNVKIVSARFTAIDDGGKRVPDLPPEEAARQVGGPQKLRDALTDESTAGLVAKEVGLGPAAGTGVALLATAEGGPLGMMVGVFAAPAIAGFGFYNGVRLATSPQQRLDAISYTDSQYSYLTTDLLGKDVFIYFPAAHYCSLETKVHLHSDANGLESDRTITQDWPSEQPLDPIAQH